MFNTCEWLAGVLTMLQLCRQSGSVEAVGDAAAGRAPCPVPHHSHPIQEEGGQDGVGGAAGVRHLLDASTVTPALQQLYPWTRRHCKSPVLPVLNFS